MDLKAKIKVTLKVAGIGSFWHRVSFVAYFQILSTIKRIYSSSWSPCDDGTGLSVVFVFFSCLCTFLQRLICKLQYTYCLLQPRLSAEMSHSRELLRSGILVIWTVVSLIASKLRRHLFPVLDFNFLRTFTNPQFCMTSTCYMHNYLMTLWNIVYPKKLPVLWNGFSGAGNVKVSCLSQNSQDGQTKSL